MTKPRTPETAKTHALLHLLQQQLQLKNQAHSLNGENKNNNNNSKSTTISPQQHLQ